MNQNILGIVLSFAYISSILLLATFFNQKKYLSNESSRKFIHITVGSGWWIIAINFFTSTLWAMIVPLIFIFINSISLKFNIVKAMERDQNNSGIGTVYYAISLTILAFFCFQGYLPMYIGGMGIFAMTFGDGFASIIGRHFPSKTFLIFKNRKSLLGSFTVFFLSFFSSLCFLLLYNPEKAFSNALLVGFFALLMESLSPFGLDNLTVPLGSACFYYFVLFKTTDFALLQQISIGFIISGVIALFAWILGSLTNFGAITATLSAGSIYAFGGLPMWSLLMIFFLSSTMIGKSKKIFSLEKEDQISKKSGSRDGLQVLANSLPALISLMLYYFTKNTVFLPAAICAIASSMADTWASEIGVLSKKDPISILTGKSLPSGLSGGVSLLGFIASFIGSMVIAGCALLFYHNFFIINSFFNMNLLIIFLFITLLGFLGGLVDSFLGATLQVKYKNINSSFTEQEFSFGKKNRVVSGIIWIDNDMVNFLSGLSVSIITLFVLYFNK